WLALSAMFILLASGLIIWKTQQLVRGGVTNYIVAATSLLADIFVLFNNILHLLGFGFGDD
nr:BAX inhibitor (BI)-1/YccA family protein [Xanthomonadales bacterium]NIX13306.1 BAX inhibitor (BI)-1/YccA family protein [Xanthomonadales bacterium]